VGLEGTPTIEAFLAEALSVARRAAWTLAWSRTRTPIDLSGPGWQEDRVAIPEGEPIDPLWTDRPAVPGDPIVRHPLRYAGESAETKIQRLRAALTAADADVHVIPALDSIAWLFNLRATTFDSSR